MKNSSCTQTEAKKTKFPPTPVRTTEALFSQSYWFYMLLRVYVVVEVGVGRKIVRRLSGETPSRQVSRAPNAFFIVEGADSGAVASFWEASVIVGITLPLVPPMRVPSTRWR